MNIDSEWIDVSELSDGEKLWQNSRCSALFKYPSGECSYIYAIVWQGEQEWDTFTGRVYVDDKDFKLIGSSQLARFPFKPKTFYIDVVKCLLQKKKQRVKICTILKMGLTSVIILSLKTQNNLARYLNIMI